MNAFQEILARGGTYRNAQGEIDPYRSEWTPGSWSGMVGGNDNGATQGAAPTSFQYRPDAEEFWRNLGYQGPVYVQAQGEARFDQPQFAPEFLAWAQANGFEPGYSEGYGGVLQNGQIVPGSAQGNRTNDDRAIIAAQLGLAGVGAYANMAGVGAEAAGAAGGSIPDIPLSELSQLPAEFGGVVETGAAAGGAAGGGSSALLPMGAEAGIGALPSVPAVSGQAAGGGWLSSIGSFLGSDAGQLLGQVGSAAYQASTARDAARTQQAATGQAIGEQRRQFDLTRTDQAPYREAGVNALRELVAGTNAVPTHEQIMSDPGYQFAQQQGERGIRNEFAAKGGRLSGPQQKAAIRFNQGNASSGYNAAYQRLQDILNRYSSIAGLGQTSTQASAAAGQNSTNAITGLLSSQGDATAASQLAQGNIWGNAGNNLLAQYGRKRTPKLNPVVVDGRTYYEATGD